MRCEVSAIADGAVGLIPMSALTPKADMCGALANVRFVPIADMSRRAFDPRINFAAQHLKIDWFGEKRLGPGLQCLALGLRIAVRGDHNNRDVGSSCLSL